MLYQLFAAVSFFVCMAATTLSAQPAWAVNPSQYEYTMTVISVAVFQCEESTDGNDMIAAFINGQVRGVQSLNTNLGGRRYAYMIIYDNQLSGSEVSFKLYDSSRDTILNAVNSIEFTESGSIGSISNPLKIKTDHELQALFLTRDSINYNDLAGTVVADIFAVNEIQGMPALTSGFIADSLGPDNSYFSIAGNQLVLLQDVDVTMKNRYQIHLFGTTESGCTVSRVFVITVVGNIMTDSQHLPDSKSEDVLIYPNPTKGQLYFESNKRVDTVNIYNLAGQLVLTGRQLYNAHAIDVSNLKAQTYSVVFQVEGRAVCKQFIVQQ